MSALFDILKSFKETLSQMNYGAIAIGEMLRIMRDEKMYLDFGNDLTLWTQFLDMIGMSYAEAQKYINLATEFEGNTQPIPAISPNRLKKIIKYYRHSDIPLEGWFALADTAPQKDFNDEINKLKGKKSYMDCEHGEVEELLHCKTCGRWLSKKDYETHKEEAEDKEAELIVIKEETG